MLKERKEIHDCRPTPTDAGLPYSMKAAPRRPIAATVRRLPTADWRIGATRPAAALSLVLGLALDVALTVLPDADPEAVVLVLPEPEPEPTSAERSAFVTKLACMVEFLQSEVAEPVPSTKLTAAH